MDYIISTVLEKIQEWYLEFLQEEDIEEELVFDIDEGSEEVSYDLNAYTQVCDKIMELSIFHYKEFLNVITLLCLEYYNIICSGEYEFNKEDIEILKILEEYDKQKFISSIESGETEFLDNILTLIFEHYEFGYYRYPIDFSCYNYNNMNNVYTSDVGKKIYEEFHPNLLKELNGLNRFKKEKEIEDTIDKIKIKSSFEYIYYILVFKQIIKNKLVLLNKFANKLIDLEQENNTIYKEILNYVIGYFYVVMDKKQENNEKLNELQMQNLEWLRNNSLNKIYDSPAIYCFIKEFINYDLIEYDNLLNESSDKVKQMVKKLSYKDK